LLYFFSLGLSGAQIANESGLRRERVLRALLLVRSAMGRDIPPVFSGVVEVDETYVGGAWRNQRQAKREQGTKRGRGVATKQPVFGILARGGQVWAEVVPNVQRATLQRLIKQRVELGSTVCTDTYGAYTGIAAGGYVHRMVEHGKRYSDRQGGHINGLEGFWGYLKRRLAAKGGIRQERLHLYIAEYAWRYNHRKLSSREQVKILLKLIQVRPGGHE
jgi:transposase-like protein|tara:strand:- start:166 stop:819 length:654 start_codon:yes stop_codon:yes gene_type:complete